MRSCSKRRGCCENAECRMQNADSSAARFCILHSAFCISPTAGVVSMIVIKFGGTSVGDAQRVANAIDIVAERRERDPIVVVSALAGVTNDLVASTEAACAGDMERVNEIVERVRRRDRKSTRLNSSHLVISYAVFCLKKKK